MTLRPLARKRTARRLALALLACGIGLAALPGCDPRQAMYFLQPFDPKIPAPCPSLKGKKIVILATTAPGAAPDVLALDRELAAGLAKAIRENVKKVEVVNPAEVADWAAAKPTLTDPVEAAEAFDADVVISLEVREFRIQDPSSPGLFQGQSEVAIRAIEYGHPKDDRGKPVTTQPKESSVLWEGERTTAFPVTGHIPMEAGTSASAFRSTFLKRVISEVSWAFVDHAPGDNIQNTRIGE